jgi:GGDEF domain-containing protein
MNKKQTTIFTSIIATIFAITISAYIISLCIEFSSNKKSSDESFSTITKAVSDNYQFFGNDPATLQSAMNAAIGQLGNVKSITVTTGGTIQFAFPSKSMGKESSKSAFTRSYSTTIIPQYGDSITLTASLYLLKPISIYNRGKIVFMIILVGTLASILFLIIMVMKQKDEQEHEDNEQSFEPIDISSEPAKKTPVDDDFDNIDNTIPIVTKRMNKPETADDVPADDVPTANDSPIADDSTIANDSTIADNSPTSETPVAENTKGLFSPVTGFGWESYFITRLDSELVRAASNEQDLALFMIRIPYINWKDEHASEICKLIIDTFKFNDLVFEYKHDGCAAIMQNVTTDQALALADNLHISITSLLAKYGFDPLLGIGISTRSLRLISGERLFAEAEQALLHALDDKDSPVVAFRVNPTKYREFLADEAQKKSSVE